MSNYSLYLKVLCQISQGKRAELDVDGYEIIVEKLPQKGGWRFSSFLYNGACSRFDCQNTYLFHDREKKAVFLVEDVYQPLKFICFRETLSRFLSHLSDWQDGFDEMVLK